MKQYKKNKKKRKSTTEDFRSIVVRSVQKRCRRKLLRKLEDINRLLEEEKKQFNKIQKIDNKSDATDLA